MWDTVKSLGKVKEDDISLFLPTKDIRQVLHQ